MFHRVLGTHPRKIAAAVGLCGLATKVVFGARKDIVFDIDETLVRTNKIGTPLPCHAGIRSPPCDDVVPPFDFTISFPNAQDPEDRDKSYKVWIRPHARWTLRLLSTFANVHAFTAATQDYADAVLDKAFPPGLFKSRWYRPSCVDPKGYGKDLTVVASAQKSNLENALLIDDRLYNRVDMQNFHHIPSFHPKDPFDIELIKVLVHIVLW